MTRPGIVRADTIDLQPQNQPSAQDHSRTPVKAQTAPTAPHQAAELRHVAEERHSEEEILSNAWQSHGNSNSNAGLSDEPGDDDDTTMRDDESTVVGRDAQEGEDSEMDDDMMDKISSSPSISDGGFARFHTTTTTPDTPIQWPRRSSSLYTPTPPSRPHINMELVGEEDEEYEDDAGMFDSAESSPFVTTPAHLPAARPTHAPRSASPFPFRGSAVGRLRTNNGKYGQAPRRPSTPLSEEQEFEEDENGGEESVQSDQSSSPFIESPQHLPLHFQHNKIRNDSSRVQSSSHHHWNARATFKGKAPLRGGEESEKLKYEFDESLGEELSEQEEEEKGPPVPPKHGLPSSIATRDFFYRQPKLVKSASDIEFEAQLLPVDDPMLSDDVFFDSNENIARAKAAEVEGEGALLKVDNQEEDDEGWETESDTKYSSDSFDSALFASDDSDDDDTRDCDLCEHDLPHTCTVKKGGHGEDDRFIDSGWGGECLRETEDIDFEFVYALHTFVATVEGQANAQKGDTMVLLDDSNSYWWLVRVVKDSTIGYLPAEHIETPTERLARLNKHRNVDLSQTMLGDTTEKTKNPLKKAMRRRNAKTVTFTSPTYIEPSEYEYTTDDDSGDDMSLTNGTPGGQVEQKEQTAESGTKDEISTVAPLKIGGKKRDGSPEKRRADSEEEDTGRRKIDESRKSDEDFDREFRDEKTKQSKNGTPRNTDSFFRDESIETRKITLTPNILRDDSSGSAKSSLERGPSLELLEKDPKPGKGSKKEKKPGMLSGLFKRKDKKGKGDEASGAKGKLSGETLRDSPTSEENSPIERPGTSDGKESQNAAVVQRTGSKGKLQKSPPTGSPPTGLAPAPIIKKVSAESMGSTNSSAQSTPRSGSPQNTDPSLQKSSSLRARAQATITSKLHTTTTADEAKPAKVKRAKQREALDIDSSPDEEAKDPFADTQVVVQPQSQSQPQVESRLAVPPGPGKLGAMSSTERLSESPVHITSADAMPDNEPPALVGDTSSSSSDELTSLRSSPSPPIGSQEHGQRHLSPQASLDSMTSPSQPQVAPLSISKQAAAGPPSREPPTAPAPQPLVATKEVDRSLSPARNNSTSTQNSTLSPTSPSPVWSDAHLRAYMDTTEDIRDLLVVVHDTNGVVPVGPDHPLMSDFLVEERGKVRELDLKLDGLLGGWLAKKRAASPTTNGLSRKTSTPIGGSKLGTMYTA